MKNELRPPRSLRARIVRLAGGAPGELAETFVVFSWPTSELELPPSLTEAERDVVRRWVSGATAQAIASARRSSVRTVQNQLRAIYQKLGVSSRAELVGALRVDRRSQSGPRSLESSTFTA